MWQDMNIADAQKLFDVGLSDTQNIEPCKSAQNDEIIVPDAFDWREEHPECKKDAPRGGNATCPASAALSTLSAAEDRICAQGKKEQVTLAVQEITDCDKNSNCTRGTVNKVLQWGKRRGFIPESCYPATGEQGECPDEHLAENECRQANNFYKVIDFCIATDVQGIRKEIMTNGPVLAQMTPYTDLLTYGEGVYQRTSDSFRYNGNHVVKVVGWESSPDGSAHWIVENTWGADWGENGTARVASGGDTSIDFFAMSFAMYPMTMADFYAQQEAAQSIQMDSFNAEELIDMDSLEEDIQQIFLDELDSQADLLGDVLEEGISLEEHEEIAEFEQ